MPPSSPPISASATGPLRIVEEAGLRPLDPDQFLAPAGKIQRTADLHGRIGVDEIVTAARLDPEQQIEEAREGGRLAGLVGTVDDMQVGTARSTAAEVDPAVSELAVAGEVEAPKPHLSRFVRGRRVEPGQDVLGAIRDVARQRGLEALGVVAEDRGPAFRRQLPAQFLGDGRHLGPERLRLQDFAADEVAQFGEGIAERAARAAGLGGYAVDLQLLDPASTNGLGARVGLGLDQVAVAPKAPGQRRAPGEGQPRHEMLGGGGVARPSEGGFDRRRDLAPLVDPARGRPRRARTARCW